MSIICCPAASTQIENVMASRTVAERDLRKNIFASEKTFQVGSNTEDLGSRTNYLSFGIQLL